MTIPVLSQSNENKEGNAFKNSSINCDVLFELAIEAANNNNTLKALEMAREALIFANKQGDYTKVYIHAFMAVIYIDLLNTEQARWHIWKAQNSLNSGHFSYESDVTYIKALLQKLQNLESHGVQKEILELAA